MGTLSSEPNTLNPNPLKETLTIKEIVHDFETSLTPIEALSDEKLVEIFVHNKNPKALEALVNRYSDKIMRLALRITHNEFDAEEVLQNVFLTMVEKLHTFRGESKFSSWLYRVALNASYLHVGAIKKKNDKEIHLEDYEVYNEHGKITGISDRDWSSIPDEELLNLEGKATIERAIDELPLKYRVVFQLGDVEGLPDKDIAEVLNLSLSAVKSRTRRARLFLRDKLSEYFQERIKR